MGWRRACPRSSSSRSGSPIPSPTARMAAAAPVRARPSGSSAITIRTTRVTGIDWRRSASSDNLFVREREWEAAHTVWLWVDLSASMRFRSSLSKISKESRCVVLALALAELLSRGGERVGVLGGRAVYRPRGRAPRRRGAVAATPARRACRPRRKLSRFSECLLFSDFLEPVDATAERLETIAGAGRARPSHSGARSGRGDAALRRPHRVCRERRPATA